MSRSSIIVPQLLCWLLVCLGLSGGCSLARGTISADALAEDITEPARLVSSIASAELPSQSRDWRPEQSVLPFAEVDGEEIVVHNVRGCRWRSDTDYDVKHSDWRFRIDDIRSVDFVVVPFPSAPMLAHTMISFGLSDGRQLALSVEARLEADESYSAIAGTTKQYDLIYVIADEVDLLGLRAEVRRDDVYLYKTIASQEKATELMLAVLRRANKLRRDPEFYDSLRNSCATNVADHLQQVRPVNIENDWRLILPGHSDRLAYELGLIDTSKPFQQVRKDAFVSVKVRQHLNDTDFSKRIRTKD